MANGNPPWLVPAYLLGRNPNDCKHFHHYLRNYVRHCYGWSRLGINVGPFEEEFRAFEEVRTTTRHVRIMIGPKENKIYIKRRRETPMPAKITREHLSHAGFEVDFSSSTSVLSLVLSVIIRKRIYPLTVMFTG